LNKKKRNEGVENLQLVEDQNLNLYQIRYSKHDLTKNLPLNKEDILESFNIDRVVQLDYYIIETNRSTDSTDNNNLRPRFDK